MSCAICHADHDPKVHCLVPVVDQLVEKRNLAVDGMLAAQAQLRGAVEALQHIAESAEHRSLTVRTTDYLGHVARQWLTANGFHIELRREAVGE